MIELELNNYFNELNLEKPKIMQKVIDAKNSLVYIEESLRKLKEKDKNFKRLAYELIERVHKKHPDIYIDAEIMDKYSEIQASFNQNPRFSAPVNPSQYQDYLQSNPFRNSNQFPNPYAMYAQGSNQNLPHRYSIGNYSSPNKNFGAPGSRV
jgi:hypothetical protein